MTINALDFPTRQRVRELSDEGHTEPEIARFLDVPCAAVALVLRNYVRHKPQRTTRFAARPNVYPDCAAKIRAGR